MKNEKTVLITGSAGLVGSEAVRFFINKGFSVQGIDNNLRQYFFGHDASTECTKKKLLHDFHHKYFHHSVDIRDQKEIENIFKKNNFSLIIHAAAQPSHDWSAKNPIEDFNINANGTLILLECYRKYCPDAVFIFTSTNKVYGDRPNFLPFIEKKTRYDLPKEHKYRNGIDENMSIDKTMHSVFGVSKTAADIMVQEYGKYFDLKTGIFRCGCLTGPAHMGSKLHGFLAYLVKCVLSDTPYEICGYKGKQVRDNLHSYDLINMFWHFYQNPKAGEVYNVGGSRNSNVSILEAVKKIEKITGKVAKIKYSRKNRLGDHIWYISDISKFRKHYPLWDFHYNLDMILQELCKAHI